MPAPAPQPPPPKAIVEIRTPMAVGETTLTDSLGTVVLVRVLESLAPGKYALVFEPITYGG